mgnify:CR=1 FL=1
MNNIFIHESSFIDENVQIGKNTKIWHFSHVLSEVKIGENCSIGQNVRIGGFATHHQNISTHPSFLLNIVL